MKTCSIAGCQKPYLAKGYCSKHYSAMKRYGDPRAVDKRIDKLVARAKEKNPATFVPTTREPTMHEGLCYILLSSGDIALCDVADYGIVLNYKKWSLNSYGYPVCYTGSSRETARMKTLHEILNPAWERTDHANTNKLDNRRLNLRECRQNENCYNRPANFTAKTSRFKGVHFRKDRGVWCAGIKKNGKAMHLGHFHDEEAAAKAYDVAAKELFGEFAWLNFKEEGK